MATKFALDRDDEMPSDDEFVAPPALTYSPGSMSEEGEDISDIEPDVPPPELTLPLSRGAKRLKDLFNTIDKDENVHDRINDVIKRIFDCLRSKSDERSLTFVDHGTRYLLISKLYHTVTIDLSKYPQNLSAITNLLSSRNVGRAFIKRIIFDDSNIEDKALPPPGFEALALLAIEKVPLYQLEHFEWPADFALAAMYTLRLMDRQDNLRNLAIYNNTLNVRSAERKATVNAMDQLESLRISINSRSAARNVHHIIRRCALQELHVDLRTYQPPEANLDYRKASAKTHELVQLLFEHAAPLDKCPSKFRLPLRKLVLWNVNLYRSAETWQKVMIPLGLEELEISNCAWAGNLLANLGRKQPCLSKVKIYHNDELDVPDFAPANNKHGLWFHKSLTTFLEEFAASLSALQMRMSEGDIESEDPCFGQGLKHFELHFEQSGDPCTGVGPALAKHAQTLEVLCFDTLPIDGKGKPYFDDINQALKACDVNSLRQLCIPSLSFFHHPLDLSNVNPITLQLFISWENDDYDIDPHGFANKALKSFRSVHKDRTRLRVVAISGLENGGWEFFVKCEVVVLGRKQETMLPTSYAELKKSEVDIDILAPEPWTFGPHGRA